MINNLHIKNFKSWEDTGDIKLSKITGLFGANSSGKSSILQFLLLLKQTVEDYDKRKVINLGDKNSLVEFWDFEQIVYNQADPKEINFSITWNFGAPESPFPASFSATINSIKIDNSLIADLKCFQYELSSETISLEKDINSTNNYSCILKTGISKKQTFSTKDENPMNFHGFPPSIYHQKDIPGKFLAMPEQLEKPLRNIYYVGPLREVLSQYYKIESGRINEVGKKGERTIPALLSWRSFFPIQFPISFVDEKGRSFPEANVAKWLKNMKLIDEFILEEKPEGSGLYTVSVRHQENSPFVPITEVGFGISQVLPILTLCFTAPENSTIIFEQPEIHLHPRAQFELADLFIEVSKDRNIQFIIESHSEHLLQRLQRRIAEAEKITKDDVSLYFTEIQNGKSNLVPLAIDDSGYIENWPDDFFGNEMEELAARTLAGLNKEK